MTENETTEIAVDAASSVSISLGRPAFFSCTQRGVLIDLGTDGISRVVNGRPKATTPFQSSAFAP
jgi:hypothetical protein